jgi:hypothetical protein
VHEPPTPRVYGLIAQRAPIAVIYRRGPSDWFQVLKWDLQTGLVEPGAWVHGQVYARRCDLSPDGQLIFTMLMKATTQQNVFGVVSRPPWLFPLESWDLGDTWSRGYQFVDDPRRTRTRRARPRRPPELVEARPEQFSRERCRGWCESAQSPPRDTKDIWDEARRAMVEKPQPGNGTHGLLLRAGHIPERDQLAAARWSHGPCAQYTLVCGAHEVPLDVQWAEWSHDGRLLFADAKGVLRIGRLNSALEFSSDTEFDLRPFRPDPQPAPPAARVWPD